MTRWHYKLLLLSMVVAAAASIFITSVASASTYQKTTLTVGYLTAIKGELKDKQGLAISGALTMALDEVYLIETILLHTNYYIYFICELCIDSGE